MKRLLFSCQFPILTKRPLMNRRPFEHQRLHPFRKRPFDDPDRIDAYHRLMFTVTSMEVGRVMIIVKHADQNAEELRKPWHAVIIAQVTAGG